LPPSLKRRLGYERGSKTLGLFNLAVRQWAAIRLSRSRLPLEQNYPGRIFVLEQSSGNQTGAENNGRESSRSTAPRVEGWIDQRRRRRDDYLHGPEHLKIRRFR